MIADLRKNFVRRSLPKKEQNYYYLLIWLLFSQNKLKLTTIFS